MAIRVRNVRPSREEERHGIRTKILGWLERHTGYEGLELETCLKDLQRNARLREACVAAFWNVYMADRVPLRLRDEQIGTVENVLKYLRSSLPWSDIRAETVEDFLKYLQQSKRGGELQRIAFVDLHLSATLVASQIRPDSPYPLAYQRENLEKALAAARLLEYEIELPEPKADQEHKLYEYWLEEQLERDLFGFSGLLVSGIIHFEAALLRKEDEKYGEALSLMAKSILLVNETLGEAELPHSHEEFQAQEAADIFELIKINPRKIQDWDTVAETCLLLHEIFHRYYYIEKEIEDSEGNLIEGINYWREAYTFAKDHASICDPRSMVRTEQEVQRVEAEARLRRDFFEECWEALESREHLIDAEIHFANEHYGDMIEQFRRVLVQELPVIVPQLTRAFDQRGLLDLNWMGKQLSSDPEIRGWVKSNIGQEGFLLNELPGFLRKFVELRNWYKPPSGYRRKASLQEKEQRKLQSVDFRKRLLGINQRGLLHRLLEIKRTLSEKEAQP